MKNILFIYLIFLSVTSCTSDKDRRIEEIKTEYSSLTKELEIKTTKFEKKSKELVQAIEDIQYQQLDSDYSLSQEDRDNLKTLEDECKNMEKDNGLILGKLEKLGAELTKLEKK